MHELQVQAAQRGRRDGLPALQGASREFDHETIERHLARAKALRNAELRRLWHALRRAIVRALYMNRRRLPSRLVVRT